MTIDLKYEVVDKLPHFERGEKYSAIWNDLLALPAGKCLMVDSKGWTKAQNTSVYQSLLHRSRKQTGITVRYRTTPEAMYIWLERDGK